MTLASVLILEVSEDLHDQASGDTYARWSEEDLLKYLNAGERQLVYFKPTAYVYRAIYQLVPLCNQDLPDGTANFQSPGGGTTHLKAIELIEIKRNWGTDGLTGGASILPVDPNDMDEVYPGWRSETAAATVQHYMYNPKNRTRFEVYPPQPSSSMGYIEAIYSAVPTELTSTGESINLRDEYREPLKEYMKHRAYAKDAQNSQFSGQRAMAHFNQFLTLIGRKDLVETKYKGVKDVSSNQFVQK